MEFYDQLNPYRYYIIAGILLVLLQFLPTNSLVEGFDGVDSENHAPEVETAITKILDTLNVSKYRANYEDIINNKIKWCDSQLLAHIVSPQYLDLNNPMKGKTIDHIKRLNKLQQFKDTLTDTLNFMDKQ